MADTKKTKKIRLRWGGLIRWVIGLAVVVALQPWLWQAVTERAATLQQQRQLAQQLAQAAEQLSQLQAADQEAAERLSQLETLAPPAEQLTTLLGRLERVAAERALRFELLSITEEPAGFAGVTEPLQAVSVSAQATGSPDQLVSFMQAIEYAPELVLVASWSLTGSGVADGDSLAMTLVYFLHASADN